MGINARKAGNSYSTEYRLYSKEPLRLELIGFALEFPLVAEWIEAGRSMHVRGGSMIAERKQGWTLAD